MIDREIASRVAAYKGNPQALQQKYAASQQLIDLLALQKIKSAQEAAAREMQMQMAQQQAANGESSMTVAQQREKEVMDMTKNELAQQRGELAQQQQTEQKQAMQKLMGGIASAEGAASAMQPKAMAAGGIVAFNGEDGEQEVGSEKKKLRPYPLSEQGADWVARKQAAREAEAKKPLDEKAQAALQEAQRTGDRNAMMMTIKKLGAAGYDVATLIPRAFMGVAEDLSNTRLGRALGADFKIPQAAYGGDRASMTPMMDRVNREEQAGIAALAPKPQAPAPAMGADAETQKLARLAANPPAAQNTNPALQPGAPMTPPPPQAGPRPPAPPRPPAQQGLGGLQMGPPEDTVQNALNRQTVSALKTNPQADKLAEEKRVEERLQLTPAQRAVHEEGIAGLRGMYDQDFDPEMQRREGIKRYLLGMGGRSMGEFAGGAGSAMDFDTRQKAQKLARFKDLQEKREGLVSLEREPVKSGIDAGFKTFDQASQLLRSGLQAGTDITKTEQTARDNAAMRDIERLKIQAQNAATAAQRDANDYAKLTGHLSTITNNRAKTERDVMKLFQQKAQLVEMALMANPKDKEALRNKAVLQLEIDAAVDKATKPYDSMAAAVQAKLYGGGQGGLGGFTVREKPTK